MPSLTGLVIAGGRSSRMGRDKLSLLRGAEPWWQWQRRTLLAAGASTVLLSRRPGQPAPEGQTCIHDFHTNIGPVAGLHAGLRQPCGTLLAVLAVDMPLLGPAWFEGLLAQCGPACGAVHEHDGFLEPLAAIYPACALAVVENQIQLGSHSLQFLGRRLAAQGLLRIVPLPAALRGQALSLNTPQSLRSL